LVEGDELVFSAVGGPTAPSVAGSRVPSTARPAGDVVQTRSPVVVADVGVDARLIADDPILAAGHAAYLGVPLVGMEQGLQGVLASGDEGTAGERLLSIQRGGDEAWLSLTEAVMHDPVGSVSGRIFAFRDVSAERTVEEMKSTFVSTVSHQLRAPLTSIYGFADTLLRRDV